jgi:spore coat protein U-like protein
LSYDLHQPSAMGAGGTDSGTNWGDGTNGGNTFSVPSVPSIAAQTVKIFGVVPGGQDVATGNYADSITATVNF